MYKIFGINCCILFILLLYTVILLISVICCRLRGTGGDLVIMEEAAFIAQDVWSEVVIPLIEVKNTALIAISTPLDTSNFYSNLISMKADDGTPVFEVLQASAACAKCIAELDDPSKCPHVNLERPAWKSKEKQQIVKALYNNNKQMMLRESMGVVTETADGVFVRKTVNELFDKPRRALVDTQHVYIAIDPTGAGPSKFAIVSIVRHEGSVIIVGLDNAKMKTHEDMRNLVTAHLNKLKTHFELLQMDPWYIFMIESNLGMEAAHIAHVVEKFRKVRTIWRRLFSSAYGATCAFIYAD